MNKKVMSGHRLFIFALAGLLLAIAPPAKAEQVTMRYGDLTLNANLEMADGKDYSDGMIIILHGMLAHHQMEIIRSAQQVLLDNERSSLAINLSLNIDNRQGFHDCLLPHRHLQEDALLEIDAWVQWLRQKGVSKIALMGHSRGANQLMVYARDYPSRDVTHLVMLAPGAGGTKGARKLYEERYGTDLDEIVAFAEQQVASGSGDELMKFDFGTCPQTDATPRTFLSYWKINNRFSDFSEVLAGISVPTLILIGNQDELQPNAPELLASATVNERVSMIVIESAGHFFRDLNLDEAIEYAIEFIDQE